MNNTTKEFLKTWCEQAYAKYSVPNYTGTFALTASITGVSPDEVKVSVNLYTGTGMTVTAEQEEQHDTDFKST